jgi:hypothetical protein
VKDAGWCTETESTGSSPRAQLPVRYWSRSIRGPTCHRSQSLQDSASLQRGSAQTHQNRAEERSLLSHSTTTCAPSTDMQPIHVSMRADVALCASEFSVRTLKVHVWGKWKGHSSGSAPTTPTQSRLKTARAHVHSCKRGLVCAQRVVPGSWTVGALPLAVRSTPEVEGTSMLDFAWSAHACKNGLAHTHCCIASLSLHGANDSADVPETHSGAGPPRVSTGPFIWMRTIADACPLAGTLATVRAAAACTGVSAHFMALLQSPNTRFVSAPCLAMRTDAISVACAEAAQAATTTAANRHCGIAIAFVCELHMQHTSRIP